MNVKNKVLNYIKKSHKYLIENQKVSVNHIKLLKFEVSYQGEYYMVFTYTQKVATGVFLRHFIWVTEDHKNFFLVNTQQKFKLNSEEKNQSKINSSSMYESIGGGVSKTDEESFIHGKAARQNKYQNGNISNKNFFEIIRFAKKIAPELNEINEEMI